MNQTKGLVMFYCDSCAKKNDWPKTISESVGPCEICGSVCVCNDKFSSSIRLTPLVKNTKKSRVRQNGVYLIRYPDNHII